MISCGLDMGVGVKGTIGDDFGFLQPVANQ